MLYICNHIRFSLNTNIYINRSVSSVQIMKGGTKKTPVEEIPVYEVERKGDLTIRRVKPMIQQFETFAKGRWLGREIIEVVSKEFGGHTMDYWLTAFKHGHIRINGHPVNANYRFQNSDRFLHRTHRHEPPVLGDITFIAESSEYFAVCKPSSIPVHPCGAFRYNSLENILKYEPLTATQPAQLHLVHRLDKVTSGLVIFAKSQEAAAKVSKEIRDKSTDKRYLARVKGRFPENMLRLLHPVEQENIVDIQSAINVDVGDDNGATNYNNNTNNNQNRKRSLIENNSPANNEASSASASSLSWEEKKRQRKERFNSSSSAAVAADYESIEQINNNNKNKKIRDREGKGADVSLSRTAPPLEEVRAHVAVGYYFAPQNNENSTQNDDSNANNNEDNSLDHAEGYYYIQCPLDVVSRRDGVHACFPPPQGRVSVTKMRFISYDAISETSLIECQPVTGRTHQIRLHCQLMGHSIANDPCYGGELFYRDTQKQKLCREAQQMLQDDGVVPLSRVIYNATTSCTTTSSNYTPSCNTTSDATLSLSEYTPVVSQKLPTAVEKEPGEDDDAFLERSCRYCGALRNHPVLRDTEVHLHCDGIWLHAWKYAKKRTTNSDHDNKCNDNGEFWSFEAPLPQWATDLFTTST